MSDKHVVRGILAGIAGGLFASWVMNEFMAGPGKKLTKSVQTREQNQQQAENQDNGEPDATMKTADKITELVTGGRHLTYAQEQAGGPIVHYAFGALAGGLYGGLAELSPLTTAGFGTTFGGILFTTADLLAVPAFHLGAPLSETPAETLVTPFAAHLVYGVSTELVRRLVRRIL
jgi:putative membrane protein